MWYECRNQNEMSKQHQISFFGKRKNDSSTNNQHNNINAFYKSEITKLIPVLNSCL